MPSGSMGVPADLSRYQYVSFYLKGLREGRCSLTIRAAPREGGRHTEIGIPLQVTKQWQKIVVGPETHPQFKRIDTKKVHVLGIRDSSEGEAANVIWLDEMMLHTEKQHATF